MVKKVDVLRNCRHFGLIKGLYLLECMEELVCYWEKEYDITFAKSVIAKELKKVFEELNEIAEMEKVEQVTAREYFCSESY